MSTDGPVPPESGDAEAARPHLPHQVGKYRLLRALGKGAMGQVFEAEDSVLGRRVALKLLAPHLAEDADALQRLLLEARSAARLSHPNVVVVHEVDQRDGTWFLALELLAGGSVQDRLAKGPMPWREATKFARDAALGLAAAHALRLVHRDVKPANLLVSAEGQVKVADFGLVKSTRRGAGGLSGSQAILGTPHYMSPEQCNGDPVDARSDVYALGATYHALLTGRPPYQAEDPFGVMFQHCSSSPPDPRRLVPHLPEGCYRIILKAMARQPGRRHAGAAELAEELTALLESAPGGPAATRRSGAWWVLVLTAAAALLLAAGAAAALVFWPALWGGKE